MLHNGVTLRLNAFGGAGRRIASGYVYNLPGGLILTYNRTWTVRGEVLCDSSFNGMQCESIETGHGFFISRQRIRTW